MIKGKFNLNKTLTDGRRSPRALYPPEDKDVLIIDQHTDDNGQLLYTRTVGVAKSIQNEDGELGFEWVVTDPGLKELVNNAKHPEKLFKYSPEHLPINVTEDYDQGEYGKLEAIAITNMANDDDAITTKVYDMVQNVVGRFMNKDDGDEMEKQEVEQMVTDSVQPIQDKLDEMKEIKEKLEGFDFEGLQAMIDGYKQVESKVEGLEKNVQKLTEIDDEERAKLIKNIVTNGEMSEDELEGMSLASLEKINKKFVKNVEGVGEEGEGGKEKTVVDEINEQYGLNIGESLK